MCKDVYLVISEDSEVYGIVSSYEQIEELILAETMTHYTPDVDIPELEDASVCVVRDSIWFNNKEYKYFDVYVYDMAGTFPLLHWDRVYGDKHPVRGFMLNPIYS